jgi:hypothetical protein
MRKIILITALIAIFIGSCHAFYMLGKVNAEFDAIKSGCIVNNTGTYYLVRIDDNTDSALADLEAFRLDMAEGNQE